MEEEDLELLEKEENNNQLKLKSQQRQLKLDLFAKLIFQVIGIDNLSNLFKIKFKCRRHSVFIIWTSIR